MGKDGLITRKDIIEDQALTIGTDYAKNMQPAIEANKQLVASLKEMAPLVNAFRKADSQHAYVEVQKKLATVVTEANSKWKEQNQLELALIATKKKNELATESTNRELTKQRILLSEQNKAVKQEAQNQLGLVTVYQKVQNKLSALGKEYSDLSIRKNLGAKLTNEEIKRYEFLEKKITTYDQVLKLTDATQGKHHRNVGNYTSGYNALNNSVNQLTREMPAFANSVGTGFMAISNNIPAFFDALQSIKTKNIELAKSGQPTKSMLSELGGALFSVQSLMSVGVTLLTLYGAKMVQWGINAYNSSKGIDAAAKSTETLNKAFEDTNVSKAMEEVNELSINIQLAKDGFLDKNKVVDQYNETIGKTTGLVSNLNDAEKELTENGDAYIKMTLYKAAANLALEEAAKKSLEAEKSRLKSLKDFASVTDDLSSSAKSTTGLGDAMSVDEYNALQESRVKAQKRRKDEEIKISTDAAQANINIAKKFQTDAAKIAKGFNFNFFGDTNAPKKTKASKKTGVADSTFELEKQRLERTIAINNDIVKDSERTDQERLKSLENSENAQIELIFKSKENQLKLTKETFNKELKEGNKTSAGLTQLRKNYEADKLKISEDAANKIVDIEKKTADEIEKIRLFDEKEFTDALLKKTTDVEIASSKAVAIENEEYKKILDNKLLNDKELEDAAKKHEENLFNIKLNAAKELAKILIANTELELAAYKQQSDGSEKSKAFILALEKKLYDAKAKLTELGLETFKKGEEEKVMTAKEKAELTLEIAMNVTNELGNLASSFSDAKIQKIDDEISKNNEYYDKQIELAGKDERQKDLLQKQRDKKNEALEKKKREAQYKQAVFDKAVNVAMIAMSTALAVVKAYTEGDPYTKVARSIMAGVVGALQLAAAIATPIPKYKMGRKGGPAEVAEVGDGGIHEVISRPDGSGARITPNKPTLTFLQQDDVVHKSVSDYNEYMRRSVLKGFYKEKELASSFQMIGNTNDNSELLNEMKLTREAIKKQKTNVHVTNKIDFDYENYRRSNINWRR
jgi:hypothetical protein